MGIVKNQMDGYNHFQEKEIRIQKRDLPITENNVIRA